MSSPPERRLIVLAAERPDLAVEGSGPSIYLYDMTLPRFSSGARFGALDATTAIGAIQMNDAAMFVGAGDLRVHSSGMSPSE